MKMKALFAPLLLVVLLAACVGSGSSQLANGGIGGTGITAGPITGFGSIFVNGIEYDIDSAKLTRNGHPATGQNEYRIGEYVTVKGTVNADGKTGTASEVVFTNELEGTVTAATRDGIHIDIMGQVIRVNALTVFHGFSQLAELGVDNVVEVSGVRDGQDVLLAASITLKALRYEPGAVTEVKGFVRQLDTLNKTFQIGNLIVDYAQALQKDFGTTALANGEYVEAKTRQVLQGNRLVAYEIELENEYAHFETGAEVELEGVVTRFVSIADFSVNRQAVVTTADTEFEDGAASALRLNALVEVRGNQCTGRVGGRGSIRQRFWFLKKCLGVTSTEAFNNSPSDWVSTLVNGKWRNTHESQYKHSLSTCARGVADGLRRWWKFYHNGDKR
ncbi:MAG: hypothetical protein BWK73_40000 [Thiothrix lacustris]|uniref:DUF5666 domain-containing protein n=1 Tax=Thiothrix lacustris TaxID=525917 RepID=A0A1Y1QDY8_9GAMM|nr:MAG: hypothetical protein BWK73_40000 [Thiothrix lacustris]